MPIRYILLVDDDLDLITCIAALFRSEGIRTLTCNSGSEAIQILCKARDEGISISWILSDLIMKNGDGVWLAEQMKFQKFKIPVVLFTSAELKNLSFQRKNLFFKIISKSTSSEDLLELAKTMDYLHLCIRYSLMQRSC